MCKSTTYQSKQSGLLNLQWNVISLPWLFLGMAMIALLWMLLSLNRHCKRKRRLQVLSDHNLHLQNQKMSSTTPFFAQAISQFAPPPLPLPYTQPVQPFSQPPVPQTGSGRAPAYEEYHPLTLKLNTPLV